MRCPGVRRFGSVRGALPKVYAGAAVNAAALIQLVNRSSSEPLVASSTPGTMLGRCELPSSPELLLDCQTLTGKAVLKARRHRDRPAAEERVAEPAGQPFVPGADRHDERAVDVHAMRHVEQRVAPLALEVVVVERGLCCAPSRCWTRRTGCPSAG